MAIRIVQSKQNARVKELRAALLRLGRSDTAHIALEGTHLLAEALRSGVEIETVFVAQGHENLLDELEIPASLDILALPQEVLDSAVSTESPQPVAAIAHRRFWVWNDLRPLDAPILILAGIQDPGNLGTILRSAEAFGATGAVLLPGTVSPWNPKAMRASAGSIFRVPLLESSEKECFQHLHRGRVTILAAMAHDAQPLGEIDLSGPVALVIGSEGSGLTPEITAQCDARITIPYPGPVESLNAAVAASVLLYEASRQRSLAPASKKQRRP
jgi:RNA methyltransferase, TrmH family